MIDRWSYIRRQVLGKLGLGKVAIESRDAVIVADILLVTPPTLKPVYVSMHIIMHSGVIELSAGPV